MNTKEQDRELILSLGGPAKVAEKCGCSVQRVNNWMTRGIPAKEKLAHPELFLAGLKVRARRAKKH